MDGSPGGSGFREGDRIRHDPGLIEGAAAAVRRRSGIRPRVAWVIGSGLGSLAGLLDERTDIDFGEIPGFPAATVAGHAGKLVLGRLEGLPVVAQAGRLHLYEGYPASETVIPVRTMAALGARVLVVLNASGGMNPDFEPGDIMVIEDHVNLQFRSPLRGSGPLVDRDRFVDLAEPYSKRLRRLVRETALDLGMTGVRAGVYCGVLGPSYETRAEIALLRKLGAHAVGMSTAAEVIAARHAGMEVLGLSCISNKAAGLSTAPLSHQEVLRVTADMESRVQRLVTGVLRRLAT